MLGKKYLNVANDYVYVSWEKYLNNLYRAQFRLFKSVLVGNTGLAICIQRIMFNSNSLFLLAIREVTQIDVLKRIPGVDGKVYFDFGDKFELAQYLKANLNNWFPSRLKNLSLTKKDGSLFFFKVSTISDRSWQTLLKFALIPAHEALFSYRSFGFRMYFTVFDLQRIIILNLQNSSFGSQKRIFKFDFSKCCTDLNPDYVLKKLFLPRDLKRGIFRLFSLGFIPQFVAISNVIYFTSFLSNIIFEGVDYIHNSVRYGNDLIFFLKPGENELFLIKKVNNFLLEVGLTVSYNCSIFSSLSGFDFLEWNFRVVCDSKVLCVPSYVNYQNFLKRIKRVVNNSNFGARIKVLKLFPLVREWVFYNRFTSREFLNFSMFFIKKRAFKIFNLESKQDRYSTRILINKCFNIDQVVETKKILFEKECYLDKHISFWFDFYYGIDQVLFSYLSSNRKSNFFCIHCGIRMGVFYEF